MIKRIIQIILLVFIVSACGPSVYVKKGNYYKQTKNYTEAIIAYEKAAKADEFKPQVNAAMAEIHSETGNYKKAVKLLKEKELKDTLTQNEQELLARCLMSLKEYDKAAKRLEKLLESSPSDKRLIEWYKSCRTVSTSGMDSSLYVVSRLEIPGFYSAFAPRVSKRVLYFSGLKESDDIADFFTRRAFAHLYTAQANSNHLSSSVQRMQGELPDRFHIATADFSSSGRVIYFSASAPITPGLMFLPEPSETVELALFTAEQKEGQWQDVRQLAFCKDGASYIHPAYSEKKRRLYFASDIKGGFGGYDLYYSEWKNNAWTEPRNLGESVNTAEDEVFPYVYDDSLLFFSSAAHENYGGMDILVMDITDSVNFRKPKHLGYPVNSEADDFGIFLFPGARKGYISSNRNGQDQIFYMEKTLREKHTQPVLASEEDSRSLIMNGVDTSTVAVANNRESDDSKLIAKKPEPESQYDKDARMLFFGPDSRDTTGLYKRYMDSLSLEKQRIAEMVEYFEGSIDTADINHPLFFLESKAAVAALFEMKFPDKLTESNTRVKVNNFEDFHRAHQSSELDQEPQGKQAISDTADTRGGRAPSVPETLDVGRIYYDYDRWSIKEESRQELDKLIRLMKKNPDMIVDLSSHTDASGSEAYNMLLSKKRALAAAAYMLSRGIEPERLLANYCGEYEPMKKISDSRVQENRRTEFRLMKDSSAASIAEARKKIVKSSEYKHCRTLSVKEMIYARQLFEGEAAGNFNYYLICGSFVHKNLAEALKNELIMKGFLQTEILNDNEKGYHRVAIQGFNNKDAAVAELRRVRREIPELSETWLLTKKK